MPQNTRYGKSIGQWGGIDLKLREIVGDHGEGHENRVKTIDKCRYDTTSRELHIKKRETPDYLSTYLLWYNTIKFR